MFKAVLIASAMFIMSCSGPVRSQEGKFSVLVSIVPQKYFVERLAGGMASVSVLIPPGASPESYELSPSDMRIVADADVWFTIGVPAEQQWYSDFKSINSDLLTVDTAGDIQRLPMDRYGLSGSDHHDHGSDDPHIWLSPALVSRQIGVIAETLENLDTLNAEFYAGNLLDFRMSIDSLQTEMHAMLDPCAGASFLVFHPAWGYFADEFNLVEVPIEIAGSEPSPGEMAMIVDHAAQNGIGTVFVSPQFSTSSAQAIADELQAQVVVIDPLAENWSENMLRVAGAVADSRI